MVRPSAKVVQGDDRDGPRKAEVVLDGVEEETGQPGSPRNRQESAFFVAILQSVKQDALETSGSTAG